MPNSPSAKKRLRQNLVRRSRNRAVKSSLKTQLRKVREAIAAGELETAATEYRVLAKKFDQAAAKGVVHANLSARIKSRLSSAIKKARLAKK